MICPICKKEFESNFPYQKYCKRECYKKAMKLRLQQKYQDKLNFNIGSLEWKRDFALGKTVSNLPA